MLLLNFAHPLTEANLAELTTLLGREPDVRDVFMTIDRALPLAQTAQQLVDAANLDARAWQTTPLVVNPPGLAPLALALAAEIHGRCGYFVPIVNVRPLPNSLPPAFEVAEIVNLEAVRSEARTRRHGSPS